MDSAYKEESDKNSIMMKRTRLQNLGFKQELPVGISRVLWNYKWQVLFRSVTNLP